MFHDSMCITYGFSRGKIFTLIQNQSSVSVFTFMMTGWVRGRYTGAAALVKLG